MIHSARQTQASSRRCAKCHGTKKKAIRIVRERPISGTGDKGRPYRGVVRRRVECANCGRHRVGIERHYDGNPPKPDSHRPKTAV